MKRPALLVLALLCWCAPAIAWSAHGHRTITYLALDRLPADCPAWLRDAAVRHLIAEQSNEPDRWRGLQSLHLKHENDPDHYLDIDLLPQFGLTLETVPPLRNEYLRAMAIAKHVHPEMVDGYDASKDPERTKEWPGFLPHAIAEHYAKLRVSLLIYRTIEALDDPARAHQLELARLNVIYSMGVLSHFVGDAAQPLHTTKHHHGWVGANPAGFTTRSGIHAYIDGGVVELHALTYDSLKSECTARALPVLAGADPWPQTIEYLRRSFERVEPLYALEKDGRLDAAEGKAFITERFADAAAMLAALYSAAWAASEPTEQDVLGYLKFNNLRPELLPGNRGGTPENPSDPPTDSPPPVPAPAQPVPAPARRQGP